MINKLIPNAEAARLANIRDEDDLMRKYLAQKRIDLSSRFDSKYMLATAREFGWTPNRFQRCLDRVIRSARKKK